MLGLIIMSVEPSSAPVSVAPVSVAPVPAEPSSTPVSVAPVPAEPSSAPVPVAPVSVAPVSVAPVPAEPSSTPVSVAPVPAEPSSAPVPVAPVPAEPSSISVSVEPPSAPVPVAPVPAEPSSISVSVEPPSAPVPTLHLRVLLLVYETVRGLLQKIFVWIIACFVGQGGQTTGDARTHAPSSRTSADARTHAPSSRTSADARTHAPSSRTSASRELSSKLLDFHLGKISIYPNPRRLLWWVGQYRISRFVCSSEQDLENMHAFIQWTHPTVTRSQFNSEAPILDQATAICFCENEENGKYMLFLAWRLLSMWGIQIVPRWTGSVDAVREANAALFRRPPEGWNTTLGGEDDWKCIKLLEKKPCTWEVKVQNPVRVRRYLGNDQHSTKRMSRLLESSAILNPELAQALYSELASHQGDGLWLLTTYPHWEHSFQSGCAHRTSWFEESRHGF